MLLNFPLQKRSKAEEAILGNKKAPGLSTPGDLHETGSASPIKPNPASVGAGLYFHAFRMLSCIFCQSR